MIFSGWKEIANYLRCSVRTVQRWEQEGLPAMRPLPGSRAHVIAYSGRVDRWLKTSKDGVPVMTRVQSEIEQTQRLLLSLSQERRRLRLKVEELRRELALIRSKHRKQGRASTSAVTARGILLQ